MSQYSGPLVSVHGDLTILVLRHVCRSPGLWDKQAGFFYLATRQLAASFIVGLGAHSKFRGP